MNRYRKINLVLVLLFITSKFNFALADEKADEQAKFQEKLNVKIAEELSDPSKKNLSKEDKEFDSALTSVVMLLKRQTCQDFMNTLTKSENYIFMWRDPVNPVIGLFQDKDFANPGCGQISLPVDEGKDSPYPIFNKIVFNTTPNLPGVLQILSQKLTKDISDPNKKLEELDLKPVYTACMFYNNNISKKTNIKNKFLRSFGENLPNYPLVIAQDSPEVQVFSDRIDAVVKEITANGCDGKRKERAIEAARRAGSSGSGAGLASFGTTAGSGSGASGSVSGIFGELASSSNARSTGAGTTGRAGSAFDTGDVTGPTVGKTSSTGSSGGRGTGAGGTIPTGDVGAVINGCPDDDPDCQANNDNCPPDDPDCTDPDGSLDPSDPGCVANLLGECIPQVFDSGFYLASTNIVKYSPQSGFIYNLPNPGGEFHTKVVRVNGQNRLLDLSIPCKASPDTCTEIYNRWLDNSANRQVLHNVELDVYPNLPDQLWVYPGSHFENHYVPFYEAALQSAQESADPIDRNNKLPYGPLNN